MISKGNNSLSSKIIGAILNVFIPYHAHGYVKDYVFCKGQIFVVAECTYFRALEFPEYQGEGGSNPGSDSKGLGIFF